MQDSHYMQFNHMQGSHEQSWEILERCANDFSQRMRIILRAGQGSRELNQVVNRWNDKKILRVKRGVLFADRLKAIKYTMRFSLLFIYRLFSYSPTLAPNLGPPRTLCPLYWTSFQDLLAIAIIAPFSWPWLLKPIRLDLFSIKLNYIAGLTSHQAR